MGHLFSSGLLWFYVLASFFNFYMKRTAMSWSGANQVVPDIMRLVFSLCSIAIIVFVVFVFIKVQPWWYGLIILAAGFFIPLLLPHSKTLEIVVAMVGMVGCPLFIVLSYLKLFAVI